MTHSVPAAAALLLVVGLACNASSAAPGTPTASGSVFDPYQTFAPLKLPDAVNRYRSASGQPGPDYWQNQANYQIHARLDAKTKTLAADETITYINHSPDALHELWLNMSQNRYRPDARGNFGGSKMPDVDAHTAGFQIDTIEIERDGKRQGVTPLTSDTRMRVALAQPLAPGNGSLKLHIVYHYVVPNARFGGRTGWTHDKNGDEFEIAQWYPRMAVYDDIRGWNTAPFLNNEFYDEYGNFQYDIRLPANMIVAGSGTLDNPDTVLTTTERQRLERARASDATVMIRTPDEAQHGDDRSRKAGTLTWRFHLDNARDVSFVASSGYVWDAARINLPGHRHALAMSVYPPASAGAAAWGRSTEYLKFAVENFSKRWYAYPYPTAVAAAGPVGGMEYPGIVFDGADASGKSLFAITVHEIGHTWFPMIVGSDERRQGWMDEGFNTFIDSYASDDFNHGEYSPKQDGEFAPDTGNPAHDILKVLDNPDAPPIVTRTDLIAEKYRHPVTYFKSAYGLRLLRDQILGPARFDPAFREYIAAWAYRHPQPSDFFRFMDSAAGEDLSWFWRGWYRHNWRFDMAVQNIAPIDGSYSHGGLVTVANLDRLVLPTTLRVRYRNGSTQDVRIPVETWMQHHHFAVKIAGDKAVAAATIDPDGVLPDDDRSNNTRKAGGHVSEAARPPSDKNPNR